MRCGDQCVDLGYDIELAKRTVTLASYMWIVAQPGNTVWMVSKLCLRHLHHMQFQLFCIFPPSLVPIYECQIAHASCNKVASLVVLSHTSDVASLDSQVVNRTMINKVTTNNKSYSWSLMELRS